MLLGTSGFGLVLPYLFIYLTKVRHLDPTWVGVTGAWIGVAGLLAAGPSGALVDRFGARRVFVGLSLLQGCGLAGYALVGSVWQAFVAATLAAMGGPPLLGALDTMFASAAPEEIRQQFFGVTFVALNIGVGLGGLVGGAIADVHRLASFECRVPTASWSTASRRSPPTSPTSPRGSWAGRSLRTARRSSSSSCSCSRTSRVAVAAG
jgi:MFS family permease